MTRLCGYCRERGHTMPDCPIRIGQIEDMRRHMVGEKRALHKLVIDNGLGIGCILRFKDWRDTEHLCTVRSHNALFEHNVFVDSVQLKYSKAVRLTFNSFTGRKHAFAGESKYNHHSSRVWFYMTANPLDAMSSGIYVTFSMKHDDEYASKIDFEQSGVELLAPSNDTDIPASQYLNGYYLPHRLVGPKGQRWTVPTLDK